MSRYDEIMKGLQEALEYTQGVSNGTQIQRIEIQEVSDFQPEEIKMIRMNCRMSQSLFAACVGVTKKAVEAWEGGRSHPDGAARRILGLMQTNPHFAEDNGILKTQGGIYEVEGAKPMHAAQAVAQYKKGLPDGAVF